MAKKASPRHRATRRRTGSGGPGTPYPQGIGTPGSAPGQRKKALGLKSASSIAPGHTKPRAGRPGGPLGGPSKPTLRPGSGATAPRPSPMVKPRPGSGAVPTRPSSPVATRPGSGAAARPSPAGAWGPGTGARATVTPAVMGRTGSGSNPAISRDRKIGSGQLNLNRTKPRPGSGTR